MVVKNPNCFHLQVQKPSPHGNFWLKKENTW